MTEKRQTYEQDDKMPVRQSIFLWVVGAIFSWVLIVVTVYSALRFSDTPSNAPASQMEATIEEEADRLNEIAPAAGGDTYPVPDDGTVDDAAPDASPDALSTDPESAPADSESEPSDKTGSPDN